MLGVGKSARPSRSTTGRGKDVNEETVADAGGAAHDPVVQSELARAAGPKALSDWLRALDPRLKDHEIKDGDYEQTRACTQYPPEQRSSPVGA